MDALVRLREASGILGVSLRSGSLRIYAPEADRLLAEWQQQWPYPEIELLAHRWAEPDMEDVFTAYSQGYDAMLNRRENCRETPCFPAGDQQRGGEGIHPYLSRLAHSRSAPHSAAGFHAHFRARF